MTIKLSALTVTATAITLAGAAFAAGPQEEAALMAHNAYLAAINANDLDAFLATVTDDIVFIAPNSPAMTGKAEVGPWVGGYFEAVETSWQKTSVEFVVAGEWAYELYTYEVVDIPRGGGGVRTDAGNGINIYRLDTDGVWRVARDAWATSRLPAGNADDLAWASCSGGEAPC